MYHRAFNDRKNFVIRINQTKVDCVKYSNWKTWKFDNARYIRRFENDYLLHQAIDEVLRENNFGCMLEYIEAGQPRISGYTKVGTSFNLTVSRLRQNFLKAVRRHKHRSQNRNRLDVILGSK